MDLFAQHFANHQQRHDLCDERGQCEGAALYGVNSIPATFLIAQDGTIIARNLRGEAIKEKLAELLK